MTCFAKLTKEFGALRPNLQLFGDFIKQEILQQFGDRKNRADSAFLTVQPSVRVKDVDSFIWKAQYRDKGYPDPLVDITDKVGVRVVVLLQECVDEVCAFISDATRSWKVRQDQNYLEQRERKPEQFLYQSQHFIAWPKSNQAIPGLPVSSAITCEIQVRTLLQHAYSELSHGTTYKGRLGDNRGVRRQLARSMALIETTDDIFAQVADKLVAEEAPMTELLTQLSALYAELVCHVPVANARMNQHILDALSPLIEDIDDVPNAVRSFIDEDPEWRYVIEKWAERDLLFRQPVVTLMMYLARANPTGLRDEWPLNSERYENLLVSMNISPLGSH